MAFIGNTPTTQAFTPAVDYFSGNASTTAFTLSRPVASVAQVQVVIDNVAQNPSSAYTISGSTITFTSAPLSGTNNIYIYYTSPITDVIAPGQGTAGTTALDVYGGAGVGAMNLPAGTTAQRPGTPVAGATRYNSTTGAGEIYQGGSWQSFYFSYATDYLVVAGAGGGGKNNGGGGGGAGGLLTSSGLYVSVGTAYTVTVGAGGAGSGSGAGASGGNSVFSSVTAIGGGGGQGSDQTPSGPVNGLAGGSGGGGASRVTLTFGTGGSGTAGQGNAGGNGISDDVAYREGGGGGGASAAGANGTSSGAGAGGAGTASSYSGSSVTYAGGGGGGSYKNASGGSGGSGGGGAGAGNTGGLGANGTTNLGGGGGGAGNGSSGGSGGSGIVIIRYLGSQKGTGGTVTSSGGYTIHTFTSSGTFTA